MHNTETTADAIALAEHHMQHVEAMNPLVAASSSPAKTDHIMAAMKLVGSLLNGFRRATPDEYEQAARIYGRANKALQSQG
ncbi:hypothetical protein [Azotobacter salinestris]|uniref:hypothetical protein n=1 Tax=Azotobacter salinestris TaxID=69964 RepID=UPI0032DE4DBD